MSGGGKPGNRNSVKHGHTSVAGGKVRRSPTYQSYRCMKERCYNPHHKWWDAYGGRGIIVCEDWLGRDGFAHFLRDLGERPEGKTLDRERVNGYYEKDNCRWATRSVQNANTRANTDEQDSATG